MKFHEFIRVLLMLLAYLLLLVIGSIDGLTCMQSHKKEISFFFNQSNEHQLEEILNNLPNNRTAIKKNCHIRLFINYTSNYMTFQFLKTSGVSDNLDCIDTKIRSLDRSFREQTISTDVIYTCRQINDCDRLFLLMHFRFLFSINHSQLQKTLTNLLTINQTDKSACYQGSSLNYKCPDKVCVAIEKNDNEIQTGCGRENSNLVEVRIVTRVRNEILEESVTYTCKFNQCNQMEIFQHVKKAVQQYYTISSIFTQSDIFWNTHPTITTISTTPWTLMSTVSTGVSMQSSTPVCLILLLICSSHLL